MTADQLFQYLSWAFYILIFAVALVRAIRQPRRVNVDIALFFGAAALIIAIGTAGMLGFVQAGPIPNAINGTLLLSMGYLLARLVDDFAIVPAWLTRGAAALLILFAVLLFALPPPRPSGLDLLMVVYLVALLAYAAAAFIRASRRSRGVTHRRMRAVAAGALLLMALFVLAGVSPFLPLGPEARRMLADIVGLASGIAFYLGFAPPRWLRRAWQEPDLRAFLGRAASLPRLPDTDAIVRELERGAVASVGAPEASIGLWNDATGMVRFTRKDGLGVYDLAPDADAPAARAFRLQQTVFSPDTSYTVPKKTELHLEERARAVLVAPITAGEKRLGVLAVYAPRAPIFAEDDLALVQLLADQAAVILESRALIDEAARVRALEQATRLKDDFLSAAAHDLKTPLTTLVARAQLLERRALRDPTAPADLASINLLVQEGQRLRHLVLELLDAARAERGRLVGDRAPTDLVEVARAVCARHGSDRHPCEVEADGPLVGEYDGMRIEQLLDNLLENGIKYSPSGGTVRIAIRRADGEARIVVSDPGIGIPSGDLPHIFDRFYRAANVDDRHFAGMGLGLFICRGIVEQHGGRIWVESRAGEGSMFHVALPLAAQHARAEHPADEVAKVAVRLADNGWQTTYLGAWPA
jgi:signal transduction histidine kinase